MSFAGVNINKMNGGLGGGQTSDRVAVLVLGGEASDKLSLNKAYELLQLSDAEALGITAASDDANAELCHYHLSEVFRLSPETVINLIVVPKVTKASELKALPEFVTALRSIKGVNAIATANLANDASIGVAVQGLQLLGDHLAADFIYIDTIIPEGKGSYLGEGALATYPDLRALDSEIVTPFWGQDPAIAALKPEYADHAAVGTALGSLMVRSIHENLGSVDIEVKPRSRKAEQDYTLTDTKQGRWLSAALSNGMSFNALSVADQKKLDTLGIVYVGAFAEYGGYFISNSHTCTTADNDYCYIERNAIWNKAARLTRATLIPRIRGKVEADPATGFIKSTTISYWDGLVRKALDGMVAAGDIASYDIYIDPNQAAVSDKPFRIKERVVADGIVHEFDVDLGYTKSI